MVLRRRELPAYEIAPYLEARAPPVDVAPLRSAILQSPGLS
jgi:hypothetical protein